MTHHIPAPGTLLSVGSSLRRGRHALALVVDQAQGLKWLERDPVLAYRPDSSTATEMPHILVRWLGLVIADRPLERDGLPDMEPYHTVVERWGYAQVSQSARVAGPDAESIGTFLRNAEMITELLDQPLPFAFDLRIILDHLRGARKDRSAMGLYEWTYREMLAEVLPLPR